MKVNPKDDPGFFRRLQDGESLEKNDLIESKDAFGHHMGFIPVLEPAHYPFPVSKNDWAFRQVLTEVHPRSKDTVISNLKKMVVKLVEENNKLKKSPPKKRKRLPKFALLLLIINQTANGVSYSQKNSLL